MLFGHGNVEARRHVGVVVPVGIVDLQLDEVDVGILGQQALEALWAGMVREAPVANDALLLEATNPVPQLVVVIRLVVVVLDGMEQILVKVVRAQALQTGVQLLLGLLGRGASQPGVCLAADGVALARVTLH